MAYTPLDWTDNGGEGISAANLERMEWGIKQAHDLAAGAGDPGVINAATFGVQADTGTPQNAALHAAFAAAEAAGGGRTIQLPAGIITILGSFPLSGYSSGLRGASSTAKTGLVQSGTALVATSQSGPVLDFTGFLFPRGQRGRIVFSDFAVGGDGTEGAAKKGVLLDTGAGGSSTIDLRNIVIYNTGGVGLHVKDHYLSEFHGIIVCNPVNCATNDTPYVLLEGANGNRWYGLGLRSLNFNDTVADVPPSGALRMVTGAVYQHHLAAFYGPWFENLHVGANSTTVHMQTNKVTIADPQFFDCFRISGAAETSYFRLEPPASQDYGGNIITGHIPGKGNGDANLIEWGVDLKQSSNHIAGPKGHGGQNVRVASGVGFSYVMLGGATVPGNNTGIVDNSGQVTNTLIDAPQGAWTLGARQLGGGSLRAFGGTYQGDKMQDVGTVTGSWALTVLFGSSVFAVTLGGATTLTAITSNSSQVGRRITVLLAQDATGGRTVTWPSNVKFAGGTAPTLTTTAGATDVFNFVYRGSQWIETGRAMNVA